ncbi:MAG: hypothetical protein JW763_04205 [candidate division Zixibacteria bacterium]|nr:hypothetical protein [candidate division Zixibacteria bacterium]
MAKKTPKDDKGRFEWPFGPRNYLFFGVGIITIIVGYITLAAGSITLAPILLVLGYCVLIPVSIIINGKKKTAPVEEIPQSES